MPITLINLNNISRMITCQEKALDEMRRGLFDVLPSGSLDALTAEDFRLLLNGVSSITLVFEISNFTDIHFTSN